MRIAQFTLTGYYNYGNMLQKFALNHTLKKFADVVEVLWNDKTNFLPEDGEKPFVQCVLRKERLNHWQLYLLREAVRQSKFKDFERLHIRTRFDLPYIEDLADEYDFFVVGSDQVWHPDAPFSYRFLEFVPPEKRIAYAASITLPELPQNVAPYYRQKISEMPHVSLREPDGVDIVEKLTGKRPLQVLDPVFLLTKDEWLAVAQKPLWLKEKYRRGFVLTYYLRQLPPPEIKAVAAELNLPVINLLDVLNYNHFTVGPAEFVWLFANASLIFTNSFHGAAFSILFKRPFLNREVDNDNSGVKMASRLTSLLKLFGLENRRSCGDKIFTTDEALTVDFTRREEVLLAERDKAFKFLSKALSTKPATQNAVGGGYLSCRNLPLICLLILIAHMRRFESSAGKFFGGY